MKQIGFGKVNATNYEIITEAHKRAMLKHKGKSLSLAEWIRYIVIKNSKRINKQALLPREKE